LIRTVLSEQQWEKVAPYLPGKVGDPGASGRNNRSFVEGVLWIARTGAPWRDLPDEFGKWYTAYTRFWRWANKGVWDRVFTILSDDADSDEGGHLFRSKPDSVLIDCGQHSDDPGQGAHVDVSKGS
jgi:putative transposase